jgi:hypothetical protein
MNRYQIEDALERSLSWVEWRCTDTVLSRFSALAPGHEVPPLRIICLLANAEICGWVDRQEAKTCRCALYPDGCKLEWRLALRKAH